MTARENLQHARELGLNKHYKLSPRQISMVIDLYYVAGMTQTEIAKLFRVTPGAVAYHIKNNLPLAEAA
jgi:DNA-binding MarR family transcriptional regulator